MTTRSIVIGRLSIPAAGGASPNFRPPAGYCYIVKTLSVANQGGASETLHWILGTQSGSITMEFHTSTVAAAQSEQFQTWLMVMDTDQLYCYATAGPISAWISGTLLPSPPPIAAGTLA